MRKLPRCQKWEWIVACCRISIFHFNESIENDGLHYCAWVHMIVEWMSSEKDEERNMREERKREFDGHSLSAHVLFGDTDCRPCNVLAMTSLHLYSNMWNISRNDIRGNVLYSKWNQTGPCSSYIRSRNIDNHWAALSLIMIEYKKFMKQQRKLYGKCK